MLTRRFTRPLLAAALLAFAGASLALAVDSKDNAALGYWRAFALVTPEKAGTISAFDRDAIGNAEFAIDDPGVLDIIRDDALLNHIIRAASKPECDFAIEYDQGIDALLPHLGPMRTSAIMLVLRARLDLAEGDAAHAATCLEAALRTSEHLVDGNILIGSLVSLAITASAQPVIELGIANGAFDAGQRQRLAAVLDEIDDGDPFGIISGLRTEKRMVARWAADRLSGPDASSILASLSGEDEDELTRRVAQGDLHGQIALYELFMDKGIEALQARDLAALNDVRDAVREGAFGDLTLVIAPSLHPVLRNLNRADELLASLRESLAR
jgi:hypothetical protein